MQVVSENLYDVILPDIGRPEIRPRFSLFLEISQGLKERAERDTAKEDRFDEHEAIFI